MNAEDDYRASDDMDLTEAESLLANGTYGDAYAIYKRSYLEGSQKAALRLAQMYRDGKYVERRPIKALKLFEAAYDDANPEAVYELGRCYFEGIGTEEDEDQGFDLIMEAAEMGYAPAQSYVGRCFYDGTYVDEDPLKALNWLKKASSKEDDVALFYLSAIYEDGLVVKQDRKRANRLLKKSSSLGNIEATAVIGSMIYTGKSPFFDKDPELGLAMLQHCSSEGSEYADDCLSKIYLDEDGPYFDPKTAASYLMKMDERGDLKATKVLCLMYSKDERIKNDELSRLYSKKAYENRIIEAYSIYGAYLGSGPAEERDEIKALEIFTEGGNLGDVPCMIMAGHCYERGMGTLKDIGRAAKWYSKAMDAGDPYGKMMYAMMLIQQHFMEKSVRDAAELLKESFDQGQYYSAYALGRLYENDSKLKDMSQAAYWYRAGELKGEQGCMLKMAGFYESGAYIQRSDERAFMLYGKITHKALRDEAMANVGRCYEEGIGTEQDIGKAIECYLKSCRKNAFAMRRLSDIYDMRGLSGDKERSVFWLRRSANKGSVSSMVELAGMYERGERVNRSLSNSLRWYQKASDKGNKASGQKVSELMMMDLDNGEDSDEYSRLARIAGEEDPDVLIQLADDLREGIKFEKDSEKARMWYSIASQLGYKVADLKLAEMDEQDPSPGSDYPQTSDADC